MEAPQSHRSIWDLPDGVLAMIFEILQAADPLTLFTSVVKVADWARICHRHITLSLKGGWCDKYDHPKAAYWACFEEVRRFPAMRAFRAYAVAGGRVQMMSLLEFAGKTLCDLDLTSTDVDTAGLDALAEGCPQLSRLVLKNCASVSDDGLERLKRCAQLAILNLSGNYLITDRGLTAFCGGCPRLSHLDLPGCGVTDVGLAVLTESCPELVWLDLHSCRITDTGLAELAARCARLTYLTVDWCEAVTDAGLAALAKGCANLADMSINGCNQITEKGLEALGRGCPSLGVLRAAWCRKLCTGVEGLAGTFPQLVFLDVSSCDFGERLDMSGWPGTTLGVASNLRLVHLNLADCSQLVNLNVSNCSQLVNLNASNCSQLANLNVSNCTQLTRLDLSKCPRLARLYVMKCTRLSNLILSDRGMPDLHISR